VFKTAANTISPAMHTVQPLSLLLPDILPAGPPTTVIQLQRHIAVGVLSSACLLPQLLAGKSHWAMTP
jgi:hypothetical protein